MIFQIFKIRNMVREGKADPGKLAGNHASGMIIGSLIPPMLIGIAFIIIFFLLAFTSFLGGPYFLGKVLFFMTLIPALIFFFILRKALVLIKKLSKNAVDRTIKVTLKVVE